MPDEWNIILEDKIKKIHKYNLEMEVIQIWICFNPSNSGISVTEKLRITGIGSVGIGQNDPDTLLHLTKNNVNAYTPVTDGNVGIGMMAEIKVLQVE